MKRIMTVLLAAVLGIPANMTAQTFQSMWKEVEDAQQKDLPQTALTAVRKVEAKADRERAYGWLLRSVLLGAKLQVEVTPDSLSEAVRRLEQREQQAGDAALKAVYDVVLSNIYGNNRQLGDDWQARRDDYRQRAMAHPEALAAVKAGDYEPYVIKEQDSEYFGHDLLSVVGTELGQWRWLADYYSRVGNRRAACMAWAHADADVATLDSLIGVYGDLSEAGELAIRRFQRMNADSTAAQKDCYLRMAIDRWGSWKRINTLRNELAALNNPNYIAHLGQPVAEVGKGQMLLLNQLRNVNQLTMRVYRTQLHGDTKLNPEVKEDYQQMKGGLSELTDMSRSVTFDQRPTYEVFNDSLQLGALPAGVYLLEFASEPETHTVRMLYFVSGLRVVSQAMPDNRIRYFVADATSGQPVGGATLRLTIGWSRDAQTVTLTTNQQGEATYQHNGKRPSAVYVSTTGDTSLPSVDGYGSYSYYEARYGTEHTQLFTDRAIYRPGQTVHAAAIVWKNLSATENAAQADRQLTFTLRDANYKEVATQQATTDRYGRCDVTFTLPTGKLNGVFTIQTTGATTNFRVEEYKRPAFEVSFADTEVAYQAGDTTHVEGKAMSYAGVPITGGKVKYTVRRRVAFWWLDYSAYWQKGYTGRALNDELVSEGETTTADDGSFDISVPLVTPDTNGRHPMFYHFVVEADVTDAAGETHHGSTSLPLGNKPSVLTCNLPQQVRSDQLPRVAFSRRNAAGKEIDGTVRYRIDGKKWQQTTANVALSMLTPSLKSGSHTLEAVCEQDSLTMPFVVFSLDDKRPATETHDWFYVSHEEFPADGSPVTLQVGASDADLHIVYSLFAGNQEIESGAIKKSAALENRRLTYREEYGNGLLLTYAWVKNGQCYRHQHFIRRPMPDRKLRLRWTTFRDRLTPGQQEQWQLRITRPDGTPADASLMAVLYDHSLDALQQHQWALRPQGYLPQPTTQWNWKTWYSKAVSGAQDYKSLPVKTLSFSTFDSSVLPVAYFSARPRQRMIKVRGSKAVDIVPMMADAIETSAAASVVMAKNAAGQDTAEEGVTVGYAVAKEQDAGEAKSGGQQEESVQLRQNLDETAFFYPTLQTDANGAVVLAFTLPESLTTWRFMGVANAADMLYGQIEGEVVAQKDVMIQPNVPRFIRLGDHAQVSARLFNNGTQAQSGTARLQLLTPDTEQVVMEQQHDFTIEVGQTSAVTFAIDTEALRPLLTNNLLVCKVTATGQGFSDGEQHYLPVLPDYERVTKTLPFTQHEAGTKTVRLDQLFPQQSAAADSTALGAPRLTIEYTNNPAWLVVQSLPTVGQPSQHSAIDQAASYYSNMVAKSLLAQSPQVKGVFEQWKREAADNGSTTLDSQLQKNEELKDLLLAETPWVRDADRESEQRQRLADFFDANTMNDRLSQALAKLQELQNADGSFTWYPGMEGSPYITIAIEEMMARLNIISGKQKALQSLYEKAFSYSGQQIVKLVADMKRDQKKGVRPVFPSFTALRWLYICAIDGRTLPADVRAANDYLVPLLKKQIKEQTIYEKALTAVVLAQRGEKKQAAEYVKSLKEYSVCTEEMGRYYDTRRASYSWYDYKIPTEVAAIEAIETVTPDDFRTLDEMRRWLLQEKRTQAWDTPINTVNAIYAFLYGQSHQLTTAQPATTLAIDGQPIDDATATGGITDRLTAGIGYTKTAMPYRGQQTFEATKTSEGTSWGALYAQFTQRTADVEAAASGISIRREVLAAKSDPQVADVPLTADDELTVGQRIRVRITIDASRDLDFVEVVDRRAACMEPVDQLSGYRNGAYRSPKDYATCYFFGQLAKGRHTIETEYYIDRGGRYETGTCTAGCAYAPEYRATAPSMMLNVKP